MSTYGLATSYYTSFDHDDDETTNQNVRADNNHTVDPVLASNHAIDGPNTPSTTSAPAKPEHSRFLDRAKQSINRAWSGPTQRNHRRLFRSSIPGATLTGIPGSTVPSTQGSHSGATRTLAMCRFADVPQPPPPMVTRQDVMRYRYNHGCNVGSVWCLEKWLCPYAFPADAPPDCSSELAAVTASVAKEGGGSSSTRANFEARWSNAVSEADFDWLVNTAHCTALRICIGYWTLGAEFCRGTPFEPYTDVYVNSWAICKTLISRASARGIGCLVDLHGQPGGANPEDHSGTNSGKAELWTNEAYMDLAQQCVQFVVKEASSMDNIIGVQIVNEAIMNAPNMYQWYDKVRSAASDIDGTIPLILSDGWDLPTAINYCMGKNSLSAADSCPLIIDTHYYWCFSDDDQQKSPQQIISAVPNLLEELDGKDGTISDRGAVQVLVGEYSCVMSDSTWALRGNTDRASWTKQFGNAQSTKYPQRAAGSFFWTLKMDWMPGGDWGFVASTNGGNVMAPPWMTLQPDHVKARLDSAANQQKDLFTAAITGHVNYWTMAAPGVSMEHWRYGYGYNTGWTDASIFFGMRTTGGGLGSLGADKIGCLEIWCRKRMIDCNQSGQYAWEFEQGFRKAVADFCSVVGI